MLTGLSSGEAARRLAADGPNALPEQGQRSVFRIVGEVVREPMLALLLGGGALYLLLGDLTEALILLAFATFSIVITVVQETRTEHVLEALRDLASPHALVIRDGTRVRIAGRDVVCGDLLILEQGDRIVADAMVLEAQDIRKAMGFIFAVHVPIAGLALLPLLTGLPLLFGPIHIALLEMIIDPVCALVFEAEHGEHDIMDRPPREPDERLFDLRMIGWSILQGGLVFCALAALFLGASSVGLPEGNVRALTFFALVFAILALIFVNRSSLTSLKDTLALRNPALGYVLVAIVTVMAAITVMPVARDILRFGPLNARDLMVAVMIGALLLVALELLKSLIWNRAKRRATTDCRLDWR